LIKGAICSTTIRLLGIFFAISGYCEIIDRSDDSYQASLLRYRTITRKCVINRVLFEELDGRAVSALDVRSRKLSTGLNDQSEDG
jgi:hypothetical protein